MVWNDFFLFGLLGEYKINCQQAFWLLDGKKKKGEKKMVFILFDF